MQLNKSHNHSHFWIEDCTVYESYSTLRGQRYREIGQLLYPDTERLTEEQIKAIEYEDM